MALSTESIKYGWEARLDQLRHHAINAINTKDITLFKILSAQDLIEGNDDKAALSAASGQDVTQQIDGINVETCNTISDAVTNYKDAVEAQEKTQKDASGWEKLLDDQAAKAGAVVTQKIAAMTEKAKSLIRALPKPAQEKAFSVYSKGFAKVMELIDYMFKKMEVILKKVYEFLKGILTAITDLYNGVVGLVKSTINFIRSIVVVNYDSIASGAYVNFIGRCNWPPAAAITNVNTGVGYIVKNLVDAGANVKGQELITDGKAKPIETVFKLDIPSTSNGQMVFEKAVKDLGHLGHYVPQNIVASTA